MNNKGPRERKHRPGALDWLLRIRISMGMTQKEVARLAGIGHAYYSLVETGQSKPGYGAKKGIAAALGFDMKEWEERK